MFRTLGDLNKEEEKGENETDSYTGGEKSGIAVRNPNERQGGGDPFDSMVNKARQDTGKEDPSDREAVNIKITLYANGFIVNDGEFRRKDDPANADFLEHLNRGVIPPELRNLTKDKPANVGLVDKRQEKYREPTPPKYVAYSGKGSAVSGNVASKGLETNLDASDEPIVDESKKVTTLQIRFHNGQRKAVKFNYNHTVSDLHQYVMFAAPVDGSYQLISGFPPKPLTDNTQTLEEAELIDCVVTQKLV